MPGPLEGVSARSAFRQIDAWRVIPLFHRSAGADQTLGAVPPVTATVTEPTDGDRAITTPVR